MTEELVLSPTPVENAPPALDTATPARAGLFATLFGINGPRPSGTLRYMISYMISEVPDIKLISYDIDFYDIIRL